MIFRTGIVLFAAFACAVPIAAEPFHHPFGEWREYHRDWLAACPDVIDEGAADYYGYSCFASTGSQQLNDAGQPAYKLTVLRNRLTGAHDIAVTIAADDVQTDTSGMLELSFAGDTTISLDFASDLETRHNTLNQFFVVDPARTAEVLEKMKQRNALTLTVPLIDAASAERSTHTVRLSLRGVLASLDFMAAFARKVAQY